MPLSQYKESSCDCEKCQSMCHRPCWGTPEDIKKIINAGLGHRLMADYWVKFDDDDPDDATDLFFDVLCPALKEFEGTRAPFIPESEEGCTFWKDGHCELHAMGLKPSEGKLSIHDDFIEELHGDIAKTWNNIDAQKMINEWINNFLKPIEDDTSASDSS